MGSFEAIILTINHFHADIFLLLKLGLPPCQPPLFSMASRANQTGWLRAIHPAKAFAGILNRTLIAWHKNLHSVPPTPK